MLIFIKKVKLKEMLYKMQDPNVVQNINKLRFVSVQSGVNNIHWTL